MPNKLDKDAFVKKASLIHQNRFDYSKSIYKNNSSKLIIICPEHGEFLQIPASHLSGKNGCKACKREHANWHTLTNDDFIKKAIKIHGQHYDYSECFYKRAKQKIKIICKIHGVFEQTPDKHLLGSGCQSCANLKRKYSLISTKEKFIEKAKISHGDKYDYSHVNYINSRTKIEIFCKEHDRIFYQIPNNHIQGRTGCTECEKIVFKQSRSINNKKFIEQAKATHGDKYNYTLVNYLNWKTKVKIICKKHGIFEQIPLGHKQGQGCPKCKAEKASLTFRSSKDDFVAKATKVHNNKYSYDKTLYSNNSTKIAITCPVHGDFHQLPAVHLRGSGCQSCMQSKGEIKVKNYLEDKNIFYEPRKKFCECRYKKPLFFDFFLPQYNIVIEFDGRQHFEPVQFSRDSLKNEKSFKIGKIRDRIKDLFCKNNHIKMIRIPYTAFDNIESILDQTILSTYRPPAMP